MLLSPVWTRRKISNLTESIITRFRPLLLRLCTFFALFALGFITILLLTRYFVVPLTVLYFPSTDAYFYDYGIYGPYPERHYNSFSLSSPTPRTAQWNADICDAENESGGLVLLDLHGTGVTHKGPAVLDLKGDLIWTDDSYGQHAMNTKVQEYKGAYYLTFWAGENERGNYYMLDNSFNLAHTVSAVGEDVWGDPHEFKITKDGTALILVYNRTSADLSETEMAHLSPPFITDAVVQEIDIESGELRFEWRASEHFTTEDGDYLKYTYDTQLDPKHAGFHGRQWTQPYDYFHMNSIDKDSEGNYLISIRHTHQIMCISGTTGKILWALGGKAGDFLDLDDGTASDFHWQHDARWIDEKSGVLGLFDNGMAEGHWHDAPHSRGRIIHLDLQNRTVRNLHSYASKDLVHSTSQGSLQFISHSGSVWNHAESSDHAIGTRDQVFIGWGSAAAYSLFDAKSEELLCETHYAASLLWYFEFAKSYRVVRAPTDWRARPEHWNPNAVVRNGQAYVSWNGGMEVRFWTLQVRQDRDGWLDLATARRNGFETALELPTHLGLMKYPTYRIAALDQDGKVLRYSNVFASMEANDHFIWVILLVGAALVTILAVVTWCWKDQRAPIAHAWHMERLRREGYSILEAASDGGSERGSERDAGYVP